MDWVPIAILMTTFVATAVAVTSLGWRVAEQIRVESREAHDRIGARIDGLQVHIDGVEAGLGRRIDGVEAGLGKRIDDVEAGLGRRIDGVEAGLGKRIDDVEAGLGKRIDELEAGLAHRTRKTHR